MIYMISLQDQNLIKIGYTANQFVTDRLSAIRVYCPYRSTVELFIEGTYTLEQLLHKQFHSLHYRGEWFTYGTDIKLYIELNKHLNKPFHHHNHTQRDGYRKYTPEMKANFIEMYKNKVPYEEIRAYLNCTQRGVQHLVARCGLTVNRSNPNFTDEYRAKQRRRNRHKYLKKRFLTGKISTLEFEQGMQASSR